MNKTKKGGQNDWFISIYGHKQEIFVWFAIKWFIKFRVTATFSEIPIFQSSVYILKWRFTLYQISCHHLNIITKIELENAFAFLNNVPSIRVSWNRIFC